MANMSAEEIAQFEATTSEAEWNDLCDQLKKKHGGYPADWFLQMMLSGRANRIASSWKNKR